MQGAKIQEASRIIGIDKNPLKRAKGEAFGMTDFISEIHANAVGYEKIAGMSMT